VADIRLRELERGAAQGDLESRARLLAARVRAGDLDPRRLDLAAYLGDPGARLATQTTPTEPGPQAVLLSTWAGGLTGWGAEVCVRAALVAAAAALPAWESWQLATYAPADHVGRAIERVAAWLEEPTPETALAAAEAANAADRAVEEATHLLEELLAGRPDRSAQGASRRAIHAGWAAVAAARAVPLPGAEGRGVGSHLAWAIDEASRALADSDRLLEALEATLVPWALGEERGG
jgi:hypothetical protein